MLITHGSERDADKLLEKWNPILDLDEQFPEKNEQYFISRLLENQVKDLLMKIHKDDPLSKIIKSIVPEEDEKFVKQLINIAIPVTIRVCRSLIEYSKDKKFELCAMANTVDCIEIENEVIHEFLAKAQAVNSKPLNDLLAGKYTGFYVIDAEVEAVDDLAKNVYMHCKEHIDNILSDTSVQSYMFCPYVVLTCSPKLKEGDRKLFIRFGEKVIT